MTKWAILGSNGMLGQELVNLLENRDCLSLTRNDCDVRDIDQIRSSLRKVNVVVNCAAWTAVDDAETNEIQALEINGFGAGNVAKVCAETNAKLIHISTDYVFPGNATSPYQENAEPCPKSSYGRTKLAGEKAVQKFYLSGSFIVRTAWLYGQYGPNFVKTILNLEKAKNSISVVNDQVGQPTWTYDLGKKIIELAESNAHPGIYHGTASGQVSWFGFAQKIFELIGADIERIKPVSSEEFIRPAPRPKYSVLGHDNWSRSHLGALAHWEDGLERAFKEGAFKSA